MMPKRTVDRLLSPERLEPASRPLERALTLPPDAYTSPEIYELEVERIFMREWLCVGRVEQVPEVGDYFTLDLLGEKLIVVRGRDAEVRVLSRICTHRGSELLRGSGNTRSFQCPYHAWSFHLDGRLSGAPHMEASAAFDKKACGLPEFRHELWQGWIFVNFDVEAAPLGPRLAGVSRFLAHYEMESMCAVETASFDSPFNWKVLVDNFMEAYHHIGTHKDTLEPVLPGAHSWAPDNEGPYSVLVMPSIDAADAVAGQAPLDGSDPNRLVAAVAYPFHLFAPAEHSLTWYQILPEGHDRFTLRIFTCLPRGASDTPEGAEMLKGIQDFTTAVHLQDIEACESVWAGLNTRSFQPGPLSRLEKPIWQFNQWWIERMAGARGPHATGTLVADAP